MSQPQRTDSKVGGDQHDLAVGDAEHVAGLAAARPRSAPRTRPPAARRCGCRRPPRPSRRRPRPARRAGSCTASADRLCSTDAVGTHEHVLAVAARGGRGPLGDRRRAPGRRAGARRVRARGRERRDDLGLVDRRVGGRSSTAAPAARASSADLRAADDHEHGPARGRTRLRRGLVGEADHGDPPRPSRRRSRPRSRRRRRCSAGGRSTGRGRRRRPRRCRRARPAARAGRRPRSAARVEQVHHLVVVSRRAGLARGRSARPGRAAPGRGGGGRRSARPVSSAASASRSR